MEQNMKLTDDQLVTLAEQYISAFEGGEVVDAIRIHADKANINTNFVIFKGLPVNIVLNIFKAANAQNKLVDLIRIANEDNASFTIPKDFKSARDSSTSDFSKYKKWLKAETENVDIRGIGRRESKDALTFPILKLYTELYVHSGPSNISAQGQAVSGRISLSQMIEATRCLAITGDPGSGKTTFLRYIAQIHVINEQKPLPVLIKLSDVYEYAKLKSVPLTPLSLVDFCMELSVREGFNLSKDDFLIKAEDGSLLWLLDSLDELPSDEIREIVVEVVDKATQKWDKCGFVLTSRPLPIRSKSIPLEFTRVEIDPWTEEEIKGFLQAWTSVLYFDATDEIRRRHWGNLLETIMERPDLKNLARNAVMVTAIAVVHYNDKRLPEGKAALLQALIDWLIHAKDRTHGASRLTSKFIEDRYKEIALAMFEVPEGWRRRVGRLWAAEKIAKHFDNNVEIALEFLSLEESETGILVRRGEGDLEFWHLSFQEYLAAKEIAGKTDDIEKGWWAKVKTNLDKFEWKEVILFVPACLNQLGSVRVDLFLERLGEACISEDIITRAKRIALGGNILRDLRLTGYMPDSVDVWRGALKSIFPILISEEGKNIPLMIRAQALEAYGLEGDERIRDFETTWVNIQGGTFKMGAQSQNPDGDNYDPDAASWEGPIIEMEIANFEIRKYQITVKEFEQFLLEKGSYRNQAYWSPDGLMWAEKEKIYLPLDWDGQMLSPNCPITGVSWYEAEAYCNWLTAKNQLDFAYKLPSEAEWEYVAKRGFLPKQHFPWGNDIAIGDAVDANSAWSGLRKKTPIGMFPNCLTLDGVFDLFGNVEEWCLDKWTPDHRNYPNGDLEEKEKGENPRMIVKGGSTIRFSRLCRPTYRSRIRAESRFPVVGFRVIRRKIKHERT